MRYDASRRGGEEQGAGRRAQGDSALRYFISLALLLAPCSLLPAQEVQLVVAKAITPELADAGSPVKIPKLDYYERLWKESLITSRALPPPEAPAGPKFTDNLTLTGTYEMNGKIVAVLIDRTTSNVLEAYIGEENSEGMKIVKVEGTTASDITKVQVQKGTEMGWVSLPDPNNPEGGAPPPAAVPQTAPGAIPPMGAVMPQQNGARPNMAARIPQVENVPPPPASIAPGAVPQVQPIPEMAPGDVPLPPP